jgi:ribonuclease HII
MLLPYYHKDVIEAGCDEAGRGCLAGPVFAAAVILPQGSRDNSQGSRDYCPWSMLNDSKQLSEKKRYALREVIEREALAWAVGIVTNEEIDKINILRASILAMHRALDQLKLRPEEVIVDGNRFMPYAPPLAGGGRGEALPYTTIVKGDGKYMSIAAASILAKTYRDDYMLKLHEEYPAYQWDKNKGYPAPAHRQAIREHSTTPYHRMTFTMLGSPQLEFQFET